MRMSGGITSFRARFRNALRTGLRCRHRRRHLAARVSRTDRHIRGSSASQPKICHRGLTQAVRSPKGLALLVRVSTKPAQPSGRRNVPSPLPRFLHPQLMASTAYPCPGRWAACDVAATGVARRGVELWLRARRGGGPRWSARRAHQPRRSCHQKARRGAGPIPRVGRPAPARLRCMPRQNCS